MSRQSKHGEDNVYQAVLPFTFWEEEKAALQAQKQKEIDALKSFQIPESDNERLFNFQRDYYANGNIKALQDMFLLLEQIAVKLVRKECKARHFICTKEKRDEIALDATALMIEQYIKNELKIKDSFCSYLFMQVRKVMYYRNKGQRLEDWCLKKGINFFELTEEEKSAYKQDIEDCKDNYSDCSYEEEEQF